MEVLCTFLYSLHHASLSSGCSLLSFIVFFIINWSMCILLTVLANYRTQGEGCWNPDVWPVTGIDEPGIWTGSWSGSLGESCGSKALACGMWHYLQVDCVGYPTSLRKLLDVWKTHTSGISNVLCGSIVRVKEKHRELFFSLYSCRCISTQYLMHSKKSVNFSNSFYVQNAWIWNSIIGFGIKVSGH